jgi:hypothetical protein
MTIRPAHELIGYEGQFKIPGGRVVYEAVLYVEATARGDKPRLARIQIEADGLHQVNRWVDWDQPIEVISGGPEEEG